ncbi:MAG: hypothetical protein V1753_08010 [Pseudomonadota bacterium]
MGILTLFFFAGGIAVRMVNFFREKSMPQILSQYQQAQDLATKIRNIKTRENELHSEIEFLNRYLARDILWSDTLAVLRDLIPEQVWLTQLSFERADIQNAPLAKLYLRGGLIALGKEKPLELLSMFVNKLKTDNELSKNFNSPVLTDSHNEMYNGKEIMVFSVELPLRK